MKLWNDGKAGSAGSAIRATVKGQVAKINRQVVARGVRAVNAMRNAELEVLKGQRSGRTYRKPHSKATYTASAPGEPPARRTGNLRMHWNGQVKARNRKTEILWIFFGIHTANAILMIDKIRNRADKAA